MRSEIVSRMFLRPYTNPFRGYITGMMSEHEHCKLPTPVHHPLRLPLPLDTHKMLSLVRERRPWTTREDQMLREAVEIGTSFAVPLLLVTDSLSQEDPNTNNPSKWHAISKHVAQRTNKDCRKRWFAKMASDVVKGGWAPDEDERLIAAIERYGTRWSLVAGVVGTRNSDRKCLSHARHGLCLTPRRMRQALDRHSQPRHRSLKLDARG